MKAGFAMAGGLAGAATLTVIHETVKKLTPNAPRMDLMGMMAISKGLHRIGKNPPNDTKLYWVTMAGDVVSNSLYYAMAGIGNKGNVIWKGLALGISAGIGAVTLPRPMGLDPSYSKRTMSTALMTIALYTIGGVVSALAMQALKPQRDEN